MICAQDSQTREVFIKLVKRQSDEIKIYRLLKDTPSAFDEENFCSVLPPVDIVDYDEDHVFIVTPRYAISSGLHELSTISLQMGNTPIFSLVFQPSGSDGRYDAAAQGELWFWSTTLSIQLTDNRDSYFYMTITSSTGCVLRLNRAVAAIPLTYSTGH